MRDGKEPMKRTLTQSTESSSSSSSQETSSAQKRKKVSFFGEVTVQSFIEDNGETTDTETGSENEMEVDEDATESYQSEDTEEIAAAAPASENGNLVRKYMKTPRVVSFKDAVAPAPAKENVQRVLRNTKFTWKQRQTTLSLSERIARQDRLQKIEMGNIDLGKKADAFLEDKEEVIKAVVTLINQLIVNSHSLLLVLTPEDLLKLITAIANKEKVIDFHGLELVDRIYGKLKAGRDIYPVPVYQTRLIKHTRATQLTAFAIADKDTRLRHLCDIINGKKFLDKPVVLSPEECAPYFELTPPNMDMFDALFNYRWAWCAASSPTLELFLNELLNSAKTLDDLMIKVKQTAYIFCKLGKGKYLKGCLNALNNLKQAAASLADTQEVFADAEKYITSTGNLRNKARALYQEAKSFTLEKDHQQEGMLPTAPSSSSSKIAQTI